MKHSMLTVSEHSRKWHYITYRLHAVSREPAILPWIYYQQLYPFGARQWQWNQITTTVRRHKWSGLVSVPRVFWLEFLTYIWIANIERFPCFPVSTKWINVLINYQMIFMLQLPLNTKQEPKLRITEENLYYRLVLVSIQIRHNLLTLHFYCPS